jgi:hypothetical protein
MSSEEPSGQLLHSFTLSRYDQQLRRAEPTRVVDVSMDGLVQIYEDGRLAMEGRAELHGGRWMITDLPDDNFARQIEQSLNHARRRAAPTDDDCE